MNNAYPCPAAGCHEVRCFKHCNSCGDDILWRPPLLDKEIMYRGPKPLSTNGNVHRCMQNGSRDGRFYYTGKKSYFDAWPEWVKKIYGDRLKVMGGESVV